MFRMSEVLRGLCDETLVGRSPGWPLFISLVAGGAALLKMYIFSYEGFVDQEALIHLIRRHGRRGARSPFPFRCVDPRRFIEAFQDPVAGVALYTSGNL